MQTSMVRAEWSKGWAYTSAGDWTNQTVLNSRIPYSFQDPKIGLDNWNTAKTLLSEMDPREIFSNRFLEQLLPNDAAACEPQ